MHICRVVLQAALVVTVAAQKVYIPGRAASACTAAPTLTSQGEPTYSFTPFSYTLTETVRTATPIIPSPTATSYGPSYEDASHLVPNLSTSSWGNYDPDSKATASHDGPYGQAAFSSLWVAAGLSNMTRGLYSATVSPTPVPTSELVYPPPLYFGPNECRSFPNDFIFGVAGSAAQVEGAAFDEGRTPAITEFLAQLGSLVLPADNSASDFATIENYYLFKQDIERLAAIGIKHYSFSISWTRILPFSLPGTPVNSQGIQHYNDLIDYVLEKGMVPIVTLSHFDVPAIFIGGNYQGLLERLYYSPLNLGFQKETFEDAFVNYGKILMSHYADRVPVWFTFNEPQAGVANGVAVDHVLRSHARIYHFYHEELGGTGQVSIKMGSSPGVPQIPTNQSHVEAALHYTQFYLDTFLNPLALGIDYPEAYKQAIQDYVPLSAEDLEYLNGTIDFLASDIYTTNSIFPVTDDYASCGANNDTAQNPFYPSCVGTTQTTTTGWNMGYHAEYTVYTTPEYFRTQLNYLWNTFKYPIMITEFGFSLPPLVSTATLNDERFDSLRSEYYLAVLSEMLGSMWHDGVNIIGALIWSWADNWEFGTFEHRFGLQYVNRTTQERFYRRSFFDTIDFVELRRSE